MRFTMTHSFACTPDRLWEIFEDPEFERRLEEATDVRREVLEKRSEGGVEITMLRCTSKREMPAPMAAALGTKSFGFDQENRLDRTASVLEWRVIPSVMGERVRAAGTTTVTATDGGCTRTITGEISVGIPLVGKKMEGKLAENVQQSYEKAAAIAREMIAQS